jgi:hypothetical protein
MQMVSFLLFIFCSFLPSLFFNKFTYYSPAEKPAVVPAVYSNTGADQCHIFLIFVIYKIKRNVIKVKKLLTGIHSGRIKREIFFSRLPFLTVKITA